MATQLPGVLQWMSLTWLMVTVGLTSAARPGTGCGVPQVPPGGVVAPPAGPVPVTAMAAPATAMSTAAAAQPLFFDLISIPTVRTNASCQRCPLDQKWRQSF